MRHVFRQPVPFIFVTFSDRQDRGDFQKFIGYLKELRLQSVPGRPSREWSQDGFPTFGLRKGAHTLFLVVSHRSVYIRVILHDHISRTYSPSASASPYPRLPGGGETDPWQTRLRCPAVLLSRRETMPKDLNSFVKWQKCPSNAVLPLSFFPAIPAERIPTRTPCRLSETSSLLQEADFHKK